MRKYQQLILIIISIISIFSLIQYRNEYLKLRYVLQVLSFFGNPVDNGNNCIHLNESFIKSEKNFYKYSDPSPLWYRYEHHDLYSAFWENRNGDSNLFQVKILAVGQESLFPDYQCRIWYDEGNSMKSKQGEFTYQMIYKSSSSEVFYYLYCESPPLSQVTQFEGSPYGVLLQSTRGYKRFVPIFQQPHDEGSVVACIKPDISALPKTNIVEFISFYNIIGVKDFIIYDNGIQHTILHAIQALAGHDGFPKSVSILPWNFPFSDLELQDEVIKADCLSRSSDKGSTLLVSWNQYLVPKLASNISALIHGDSSVKYETKTIICCTEMNDDKAAEIVWPTPLRKTRCIPQGKLSVLYNRPNVREFSKFEELPSSSVSLHIYRTCDNEEKHVKFVYEPIMAKYLGAFMNDKLSRVWKSGDLIKHHPLHLQGINLSEMMN